MEGVAAGLAGGSPTYRKMAVEAVKYAYESAGDSVDIIGLGGVGSDEGCQNLRLILAGASATAMVTGIRSGGLSSFKNVHEQTAGLISEAVERGDFEYEDGNLASIVGIDTKRGRKSDFAEAA